MTDLLGNILKRLDLDGPTDVFISEEDYPLLREEAGRLWALRSRSWGKDPQAARLFLAFLRGYTFYRPLHDNERQFWSHFYSELGLPFSGFVGADQRDALWDVLTSHPLTRPHCHYTVGMERDRREFVRAIDEIWGVRSLSAGELITIFTAYHLHHAGRAVDPALLRSLRPDIDDLTLRQARAYDRVFQTLSVVVDHIIETDPSLVTLRPEVLVDQLTAAGLDLGRPNVVSFLANKSSGALAEIVAAISQTPRKRFALRPLAAARWPLVTSDPDHDLHIQLAPGVYELGSPVTLDVIDRAKTMSGSVCILIAGRRLHPQHGQVILADLPEGQHLLEVELEGQPTGITMPIQIVPPLQWTLRQSEGRLFEGRWEVGQVTTADGRFALFSWRPQWNEGPIVSHLTAALDEELSFSFGISAHSIGARLIDVRDGQIVPCVQELQQVPYLAVKPFSPPDLSRRPTYRVFLESHSHTRISAGPEGLDQLLKLPSTPADRLIVEVAWDGHWHRVLAVPYELTCQFTAVVPSATFVQIEGYAPSDVDLTIEERGAWSGEVRTTQHLVAGRFQLRRMLRLSQATEERQLVMTLTSAESSAEVRSILISPLECSLKEWTVTGLSIRSRSLQ